MEKNELLRIGRYLFGNRWKTPLSQAMGNARETVSRWASGKPIPLVAAKAIRLLYQQGHQNQAEKRYNAKGVQKRIGEALLIHGDCRQILNTFNKNQEKVDVIITDPIWPKALPGLAGSNNPHDLLLETLAFAPSVLKDTGRIIIQMRCDSDPRILDSVLSAYPFIRTAWLPYAIPSRKGRILLSGDIAYIFGKPPPSRVGNRVLPGQPHADFCPPAKPEREKTTHPCPRNLCHVEWLVEKFTAPNETILDPFMGSGTTGITAVNRGRKFIGIEIEKKYWLEAQRRIIERSVNNETYHEINL